MNIISELEKQTLKEIISEKSDIISNIKKNSKNSHSLLYNSLKNLENIEDYEELDNLKFPQEYQNKQKEIERLWNEC